MTAPSTAPFVIARAFQAPHGMLWQAQTQAMREGLLARWSGTSPKLGVYVAQLQEA